MLAHIRPIYMRLRRFFKTPQNRLISRLSLRIFAVNVMALIVMASGLLYLSRYQQELVSGELDSLERQAQIYAGAIAEAARYSSTITTPNPAMGVMVRDSLSRERTRSMVRRLGETTTSRIRIFNDRGRLLGDSDVLGGTGGVIRTTNLAPLKSRSFWRLGNNHIIDWLVDALPSGLRLKTYPDTQPYQFRRAETFPDVASALEGRVSSTAWHTAAPNNDILLSAAVPVQHLKQVLGVVYVTRDGTAIAESIRQMKRDILQICAMAMLLTFILSSYLAASIARPLKRLARSAEQVRRSGLRAAQIPDLTARRDEIGDLSLALRDMTDALSARLDSIENFAADVAHELKNPLTSLRSAIETVQLVKKPEDRDKLMAIIVHDLHRLDRLISDISASSRLDAELSREDMESFDLRPMLMQMAATYSNPLDRLNDASTRIDLQLPDNDTPMMINGLEPRLGQVFRNLIDNALSFSPPNAPITLRATYDAPSHQWQIHVEDKGPGIPESKLGSIFNRFYTERPEGEAFGKHSGLGLSIAKQIVDAHKGRIYAENIDGGGARFTVALNAL